MNIIKSIALAWRSFMRRRRLSMQNPTDGKVLWYTHISPAGLLMASISLLLLIFISTLILVSLTPILELLPKHRSALIHSRELMTSSILRIDSMERVIGDMMLYNDNISLILEGKSPVVRSQTQNSDSLKMDNYLPPPSSADSLLRSQMQGDGAYGISNLEPKQTALNDFRFISPVEGEVKSPFNIKDRQYGVEVTTAPFSRIEAAADGIVVLSTWSLEGGYIVELLHKNSFITIYKQLSQSLVERGDLIKAGEVIGYNNEDQLFGFELWEGDKPANPENYINFK
ncbi:MAG: M23 family metallopeptidase [Rikenellaceae bacterium]